MNHAHFPLGTQVTVAEPQIRPRRVIAVPGDLGYVIQHGQACRVRVRFPHTGEDDWFDDTDIVGRPDPQ